MYSKPYHLRFYWRCSSSQSWQVFNEALTRPLPQVTRRLLALQHKQYYEKYTVLAGREYIVGRKDCDIVIEGDPSVSRKHALVEVSHTQANLSDPSKLPVLTVKDLSKFGIYINKVKITDKEGHQLKDEDEVIFGTKSAFTVVYEPFVISMSCLDSANKKKVSGLVCSLGGHIVSDWQRECTLLVMSNINVTIKVICAMAALKHIVTPEYLDEYVKYLQGGARVEPDPVKFLPKVSDTQIDPSVVSFKRNPKRSSVFQGKTFIFLTAKQYKKMSLAIELGGGTPVLMEENSGGDDAILIQKGTIVMNCVPDNVSQSQIGQEWVQHVHKYLKRHKKHMIQDAELGYAVLYCSTDKHCNPEIDFLSQMMHKQIPTQSLSQAPILAADTEATQGYVAPRGRRSLNDPEVINETKLARINKVDKKEKSKLTSTTSVKEEPLSQEPPASNHGITTVSTDKKLNKRSPSPTSDNQNKTRSKIRTPSPVPFTDRQTRSRSKSRSPSPAPSKEKETNRSPVAGRQNKKKGTSSDETDSDFTIGKKIKKEKATPIKSNTYQTIENKDIKPHIDQPSHTSETKSQQSVFGSIKVGSQLQEVKKEKDIDSYHGKKQQKRKILEDSDEDELEVPKRTRRNVIQEDADGGDDLFSPRNKKQKKQNVIESLTETSRMSEVIEFNDEPLNKHSKDKRRHQSDSDNDDLFDSNKRRKRGDNCDRKTTNIKKRHQSDSEEEDLFDKRKKSVNSKGDNSDRKQNNIKRKQQSDSDNDDLFDSSRRKRSSDKGDNSGATKAVRDRGDNSGGETAVRGGTDDKKETRKTDDHRQQNHVNQTTSGFLSAVIPIEGQVVKTEYEKEEDIPSNCVVTEFVALVSKKKKNTLREIDDENVPEGYSKWKGKMVKNFKKFKKTSHAGSNSLPRIIGGSDLEVHIASERKEIDEWFRDALDAESQQSEADRKANELFEWDPSRGGSKKRGR